MKKLILNLIEFFGYQLIKKDKEKLYNIDKQEIEALESELKLAPFRVIRRRLCMY